MHLNPRSDDEALIRRYLLGQMSDREREQMHWRQSADPDYKELLAAIEEELVDDYARGGLNQHDRRCFETHYLVSDHRRQKLHEARILLEAVTQRSRRGRYGWIAAAAGFTVAIVVSTISWYKFDRMELAITLEEGVSRDSSARQIVRVTPDVLVVRLNLNSDSAERPDSAILRPLGSEEALCRQRVSAGSDGAVTVEFPASFLQDRYYLLQLEQDHEIVASFSFQVTRKTLPSK